MNSAKTIALAKAAFHALTVAQLALASLTTVIPPKYALYGALVSSAISGLLHVITALWPSAAQDAA